MDFNFDWNYIASGTPYITISRLGLAMNSAVIQQLGNPEKVMLGFDSQACIIGVRKYDGKNNVKSYEFRNKERHGWVRIGCKDFVKNLSHITGIDFSEAKRFITSFDADTQTVYFKVENPE